MPTKLSEPPVRYQLQFKHPGDYSWQNSVAHATYKEAIARSNEIINDNLGGGWIFRLVDLRTNKVVDIEGQD